MLNTNTFENENITVLKGDIFIVPNAISSVKGYLIDVPGRMSEWNITVSDDTLMVQIWMTSTDSQNWSDHGHPDVDGKVPHVLPLSMVEDIQEGDTITLRKDNIILELTACQLKYRYALHGNFHEVVQKLKEAYQA